MIIPERKLSIILLIIGTIGISFGGLIMRSVSTAAVSYTHLTLPTSDLV